MIIFLELKSNEKYSIHCLPYLVVKWSSVKTTVKPLQEQLLKYVMRVALCLLCCRKYACRFSEQIHAQPSHSEGKGEFKDRIALKKQTNEKKKLNNLPRLVPDGQAHVLSLQLLTFYPSLKKYYCQIRVLFLGRWSSPSFPLHQTENQELLPDLEKIWKKLWKLLVKAILSFKPTYYIT